MSSVRIQYDGRLGNHVLIYLMAQYIAEKYNLYFDQNLWNNNFNDHFIVNKFSGNIIYDQFYTVNDDNIMTFLQQKTLCKGVYLINGFFQSPEIFKINNLIESYKKYIIPKTLECKNDLFVHVRLGDIKNKFSLPYEYYKKSIEKIKFNSGIIASDNVDDEIVIKLSKEYNLKILNESAEYTVRYGSQCKNLVLSAGSFSFITALFSNNSNIYFITNETQKKIYGINNWDLGMFSAFTNIDNWNEFKG